MQGISDRPVRILARHAVRQRGPGLRSARANRDEVFARLIKRVWQVNMQVYLPTRLGSA